MKIGSTGIHSEVKPVALGVGLEGGDWVAISESVGLPVRQSVLEYETVAASQAAQVLGATGATGDTLSHIVITPATTSPGTVIVLDNATPIFTFAGGAASVASLVPIVIPFGTKSVSGAWKITTGANVAVTGFGDFT